MTLFQAAWPLKDRQIENPPQSNLGRARRSRTITQRSPHWLQWDAPNSPLPSLRRLTSHLIHPFLDRPHSPSQMASGSNQPLCHSTLSGQRQTTCMPCAVCLPSLVLIAQPVFPLRARTQSHTHAHTNTQSQTSLIALLISKSRLNGHLAGG